MNISSRDSVFLFKHIILYVVLPDMPNKLYFMVEDIG